MNPLPDNPTPPTPGLPRVSVIVPVYNRLKFLDQAIESALAQTYSDVEVVVVDDGSPLDPGPIVARFGSRVRLVRKANGGLSSARNCGIAHATGDYLLFLDDDDYLEPDAIESLIDALHQNSAAVWAAGKFAYVDEQLRPTQREHACRFASGDVYERMIFNNLMGAPSVVLVRADVLRSLGGFDESFLLSEDWDMWLTLARDHPLVTLQKKVSKYRLHAQQISRTQWTRLFEHNLRVLQKHRARGRPGSRRLFDKGIAKVHLRYGDALYTAGDHGAARAQWRRAFPFSEGVGWFGLPARFVKSSLPVCLLRPLRKVRLIARVNVRGISHSLSFGQIMRRAADGL